MSEEIKKAAETGAAPEATDMKETATATPAPAAAAAPDKTVSAIDSELRSMLSMYGDADAILPKLYELGVESVDDLSALEESDLTRAGMKLVQARKLVNNLKSAEARKAAAEAATAAGPAAAYSTMSILASLPSVSSDESLLQGLQIGGILKVSDATYQAALRVFLADRAGLFTVREKIRSKMEAQSEKILEPVPPMYWKIMRSITRHNYGDLFAAIEGLDGTYITDKRRTEFVNRLKNELFPVVVEGYGAVCGWSESYNNMGYNLAGLAAAIRGGAGAGLANCPPVDPVLDASATLKDAINRVFRGTYMPVAAAMTKDAMDTTALLNDPSLPALVGSESKDIMLRDLGLNVTANVTRCEKALVQFVLGLTKFDTESVGNEINYILALASVGQNIPWSQLGYSVATPGHPGRGSGATTLGGRIGPL